MGWSVVSVKVYQVRMVMLPGWIVFLLLRRSHRSVLPAGGIYADLQYYRQQQRFLGQIKNKSPVIYRAFQVWVLVMRPVI
jgi:hypothetical protein